MIENDLKTYQLATLGYFGAFGIEDGQTATSNSNIWCVKATADITITTIAIGGSDLTDVPIKAGDVLFGNWSSVTVAGGLAIAYDLNGQMIIS